MYSRLYEALPSSKEVMPPCLPCAIKRREPPTKAEAICGLFYLALEGGTIAALSYYLLNWKPEWVAVATGAAMLISAKHPVHNVKFAFFASDEAIKSEYGNHSGEQLSEPLVEEQTNSV